MCAVPFDLLVGGDGAEDDLGELSAFEGSICYTPILIISLPSPTYVYVRGTYPTTSNGFLTIAMDRCVLSYTSRAI